MVTPPPSVMFLALSGLLNFKVAALAIREFVGATGPHLMHEESFTKTFKRFACVSALNQ